MQALQKLKDVNLWALRTQDTSIQCKPLLTTMPVLPPNTMPATGLASTPSSSGCGPSTASTPPGGHLLLGQVSQYHLCGHCLELQSGCKPSVRGGPGEFHGLLGLALGIGG